jgi:hypothetical protein
VDATLKTRETDSADGPDFICIGMGKSGTGWLYDQLLHHPQFWMPPIKELHYLDREKPAMRKIGKMLDRNEKLTSRARDPQRRRALARDLAFLEEVKAAKRKKMDLERYAAFYRFKGDKMTGDISPSYCLMKEDVIARVVERFPRVKFVLLLRDPVTRTWSHFLMKQRGDQMDDPSVLHDPDRFAATLLESRIYRISAIATVVRKWDKLVPEGRFRHFFFDDLVADPAQLRRGILTFLGADPTLESELDPEHNQKAKRAKFEMSPEIRSVLIEQFADELREAATLLGGHAAKWAEKYGV